MSSFFQLSIGSMEIDFRFHQQSTLHSLLFACVLMLAVKSD